MLGIKPVIKIWCLPGVDEDILKELYSNITSFFILYPETGIKSDEDILVLFPTDRMAYGLGNEILIEVSDLPQEAKGVRIKLAAELCGLIRYNFPTAKHIYCKAECINPDAATWSYP